VSRNDLGKGRCRRARVRGSPRAHPGITPAHLGSPLRHPTGVSVAALCSPARTERATSKHLPRVLHQIPGCAVSALRIHFCCGVGPEGYSVSRVAPRAGATQGFYLFSSSSLVSSLEWLNRIILHAAATISFQNSDLMHTIIPRS
jgi:hypothetical protein